MLRPNVIVFLVFLVGIAASLTLQPSNSPKPRDTILQSASHDVIRVQVDPIDHSAPGNTGVFVCLNDLTGSANVKAFDNRRDLPPRFQTGQTKIVCGSFAAARQTWAFYKGAGPSSLRIALTAALDLRRLDGGVVTLDWLRD